MPSSRNPTREGGPVATKTATATATITGSDAGRDRSADPADPSDPAVVSNRKAEVVSGDASDPAPPRDQQQPPRATLKAKENIPMAAGGGNSAFFCPSKSSAMFGGKLESTPMTTNPSRTTTQSTCSSPWMGTGSVPVPPSTGGTSVTVTTPAKVATKKTADVGGVRTSGMVVVDRARASPTSIVTPQLERDDVDVVVDDDTEKRGLGDAGGGEIVRLRMALAAAEESNRELRTALAESQRKNGVAERALKESQRMAKEAEEAVSAAQAQRTKMIGNLRKKKALLQASDVRTRTAEERLSESLAQQRALETENAKLRNGLQKVAAVREDLKNKLRIKQEILRENARERDDLERKLKKTQQGRAMEQELIQHYRKLAGHTGYFKWGKQIRGLESELAAAADLDKRQQGSP